MSACVRCRVVELLLERCLVVVADTHTEVTSGRHGDVTHLDTEPRSNLVGFWVVVGVGKVGLTFGVGDVLQTLQVDAHFVVPVGY